MVYYYTDHRGDRHGSLSHYKIERMAEQNYITTGVHKCTIYEFNNPNDILHGEEWLG